MVWNKFITSLWGPPSIERSLLIKLDFTLLLYFSIIWFLFGINRSSYSTAYISGMKDDLNFQVLYHAPLHRHFQAYREEARRRR